MASTFVSITTSAYTCVEFMLVWKLTFFVIPASAAIFLRHLLHTPNIVSSNTFWLGLHPFRSGNQCKADWFRGIITCLPTISTFAVLRLSAYPHLAPHPSLYISVTVSERRAWSLSSRKASASILPWRTGRRRRMTGIRERRSWTQERPSSGTELLQGSRSNFAFNALFTSLNVAKVTMKEMGMEYSMSSFKSLMTNIYLVKRIFKASGYTPNRTLISKIFKDLSCLQRIAA